MKDSKLLKRNNFSHNVVQYDLNANTQKYCANKLVNFIKNYHNNLNNYNILDLGSGTGFIGSSLNRNFLNNFNLFELDLSIEMLKLDNSFDNSYKICADFNNLPFVENSFDIIISSFAIQWCENLDNLLKNLYMILKKNGHLIMAIPNFESFKQLEISPFQLNKMPKTHEIINLLNHHNFSEIFQYNELYYENFNNPIEAIKSFKKNGSNNLINHQTVINNFKNLRNFHLNNYNFNLGFKLDWNISYFIYKKHV